MVKLINFFRQDGVYTARFRGPRWLGYEHVLLFRPAQSVVSFFLCLRHIHIVIDSFSLSVTTEYPALFRIRSTSLTFSSPFCCCRELTQKPSRCTEMSSSHANSGTICNPVPSKPQAESGELSEQVKVTFMLQTAKSAELDQYNEWIDYSCLQIIR